MFDNEALNGKNAYTLSNLFNDLRAGVWTELSSGKSVDMYRRGLQRGYVDRMGSFMEDAPAGAGMGGFAAFGATAVNMNTNDIRALVRSELTRLRSQLKSASPSDAITKAHYQDLASRIDAILDPK